MDPRSTTGSGSGSEHIDLSKLQFPLQQYDKCLSHKMCRSFLKDRLQRGEINTAFGSKVRKAVVGHYFFPEESPDKIQDPLVKFEFHI